LNLVESITINISLFSPDAFGRNEGLVIPDLGFSSQEYSRKKMILNMK